MSARAGLGVHFDGQDAVVGVGVVGGVRGFVVGVFVFGRCGAAGAGFRLWFLFRARRTRGCGCRGWRGEGRWGEVGFVVVDVGAGERRRGRGRGGGGVALGGACRDEVAPVVGVGVVGGGVVVVHGCVDYFLAFNFAVAFAFDFAFAVVGGRVLVLVLVFVLILLVVLRRGVEFEVRISRGEVVGVRVRRRGGQIEDEICVDAIEDPFFCLRVVDEGVRVGGVAAALEFVDLWRVVVVF